LPLDALDLSSQIGNAQADGCIRGCTHSMRGC
jgi:hypothetical protein